MPSASEPATAFHNVQESISAVSRSKTTASYLTRPLLGCRRLAPHPVEQVEHALAPGMDDVVLLQQLEWANRPRPQEGAEQDIVGIGGSVSGQEFLLLQDAPRRFQRRAQSRHALLARCGLESGEVGGAQPLAARFDDVILV